MRIFHAIGGHDQGPQGDFVEFGVTVGGGDGDDALMGGGTSRTVQDRARLEPDRDAALPREVNERLHPGATRPFSNHDAIHLPAALESLQDRMNAG